MVNWNRDIAPLINPALRAVREQRAYLNNLQQSQRAQGRGPSYGPTTDQYQQNTPFYYGPQPPGAYDFGGMMQMQMMNQMAMMMALRNPPPQAEPRDDFGVGGGLFQALFLPTLLKQLIRSLGDIGGNINNNDDDDDTPIDNDGGNNNGGGTVDPPSGGSNLDSIPSTTNSGLNSAITLINRRLTKTDNEVNDLDTDEDNRMVSAGDIDSLKIAKQSGIITTANLEAAMRRGFTSLSASNIDELARMAALSVDEGIVSFVNVLQPATIDALNTEKRDLVATAFAETGLINEDGGLNLDINNYLIQQFSDIRTKTANGTTVSKNNQFAQVTLMKLYERHVKDQPDSAEKTQVTTLMKNLGFKTDTGGNFLENEDQPAYLKGILDGTAGTGTATNSTGSSSATAATTAGTTAATSLLNERLKKRTDENNTADTDGDSNMFDDTDLEAIEVAIDSGLFKPADLAASVRTLLKSNTTTKFDEYTALAAKLVDKGIVSPANIYTSDVIDSFTTTERTTALAAFGSVGGLNSDGNVNLDLNIHLIQRFNDIKTKTTAGTALNKTDTFARLTAQELIKQWITAPPVGVDAAEQAQVRNVIRSIGFLFEADGTTLKPNADQPAYLKDIIPTP